MANDLFSQNQARIERCRTLTQRFLPMIRATHERMKDTVLPNGAQSQIAEQIEAMETTLWLCSVLPSMLKPLTDPEGEAQALRGALLEMVGVMGQGRAIADILVHYATEGRVPDRARVTAELFCAELQAIFDKIGLHEQAMQAHRKRMTDALRSHDRRG